MRASARKCRAKNRNGTRCRAYACNDSEYCYTHDPDKKVERKAARRRGGANALSPPSKMKITFDSIVIPDAPDVSLDSADDVVSLIAETISSVRRGELGSKIGNSIGQLCNIALRAREQGSIENRLIEIEKHIQQKGRGGK